MIIVIVTTMTRGDL